MRRRDKARAGGFADERFRKLSRQWRWRVTLIFPLVLVPLVVWLAVLLWLKPGSTQLWIGIFIGATLASYVWAIDPPYFIERWRTGAVGEQRTARALAPLGAAWHVVHDIPDGWGNVDHVAVGPSGVYLLESKNLSGHVEAQQGSLKQTFRIGSPRLDRKVPGYVAGACARLSSTLKRHGITLWVHGVIVVWGDLSAPEISDRLAVLPGQALPDWLTNRPNKLAPEAVQGIADVIRRWKDESEAQTSGDD